MSRFKNYGLWVSIAAFIPMLLKGFGVNTIPDNYNEIVNSFLAILVLSGILSNPQTDNRGYLDDTEKEDSNSSEK